MTDPGWPLIPREVLPAPVERVRTRSPRPVAQGGGGQLPQGGGRQLSIFGAETAEPSPADLAGLLAGPGRLGRIGGTARVCVPVDAAWRVHVLVAELVSRGLVVSWHPTEEVRDDPPPVVTVETDPPENPVKGESSVAAPGPRFEVRTAYSRRLNGLARAWPDAAAQLFLSGPRMRLWVAAAGEPVAGGYALGFGTDPEAGTRGPAIDAALIRAGLAGQVSDAGR